METRGSALVFSMQGEAACGSKHTGRRLPFPTQCFLAHACQHAHPAVASTMSELRIVRCGRCTRSVSQLRCKNNQTYAEYITVEIQKRSNADLTHEPSPCIQLKRQAQVARGGRAACRRRLAQNTFDFEVELKVILSWVDERIDTTCAGSGQSGQEIISGDVCGTFWTPPLLWAPTTTQPEVIDDSGLYTLVGASTTPASGQEVAPNLARSIAWRSFRVVGRRAHVAGVGAEGV
eukprot:6181350-Pleurochrysis_carterae.AAC.1